MTTAPDPGPRAEGSYGTFADPLPAALAAGLVSWCEAQSGAGDEPVPYTLTPAAEAALDDPSARGPYPGPGDPERLAQWCGFPTAAAMEAAYEADAGERAAACAADARWEAEMEAAAEAEDPEAGPW